MVITFTEEGIYKDKCSIGLVGTSSQKELRFFQSIGKGKVKGSITISIFSPENENSRSLS